MRYLITLFLAGSVVSCNQGSVTYLEKKNDNLTREETGTQIQTMLGTRYLGASVLIDIFGASTSLNADANGAVTVQSLIQNDVLSQAVTWGGACDSYATAYAIPTQVSGSVKLLEAPVADRGCSNPGLSQASMMPGASTSRFAWTIRVCDKISESDTAIRNAATQAGYPAGSSLNNPPSDQMIAAMYDIFHPGVPMAANIQQALKNVVSTANSNYPNSPEAWRFLVYVLCSSPSWQIL